MIGRGGEGGEGLGNVKYLKIINKTFPSEDKDFIAYCLLYLTHPSPVSKEKVLLYKEDKADKFPVSSARLHQNCINNQSRSRDSEVPILSSVGYK